jgi:hypothetical protein
MKISVVGAGVAGLSAARALVAAGADVTLFDKGRVPGGRATTRRQDGFEFDHGVPFFSAGDPSFRTVVETAIGAGVVGTWRFDRITVDSSGSRRADTVERYVGIPAMDTLPRFLATGLRVESSVRIAEVVRDGRRWRLRDADGVERGPYDALIVSTPPAQAVPLLSGAPTLAKAAARADMRPCWTALVAVDGSVPVQWDVAQIDGARLEKLIRNRAKSGRPAAETWVLHAGARWSAKHLELSRETVVGRLLEGFRAVTGAPAPGIVFSTAHRWRFARPSTPLADGFLWDRDLRAGACGDWCRGSGVEAAFVSGLELSRAIAG